MKSPITTHVLDTANGHPAAGIEVILEKRDSDKWREVARGTTDTDGRITDWLPGDQPAPAGMYRVTFKVSPYFEHSEDRDDNFGIKDGFYSDIPILFHLRNPDEHYHIPLLLSPYGYTTYRGS